MPHRGWELVDVEDLGEPAHTCEACGKTEIRYVHTIEHPDFRTLDVGCVCCEHLTGDYANPRRREQELRNAAARRGRAAKQAGLRRAEREMCRTLARHRWPSMRWRISARGNPWAKVEGILCVVFPAHHGYRCMVGGESSPSTYPDEDGAKAAALDGFLYVHEKGD